MPKIPADARKRVRVYEAVGCVWGERGVDLVFPKFTSCKLFWDYYSGVKNRWNPFKVEWKDGVLWNRGRFSNTTKVKIKEMNPTQNEHKLVVGKKFYLLLALLNIKCTTENGQWFLLFSCLLLHRWVKTDWSYFFYYRPGQVFSDKRSS